MNDVPVFRNKLKNGSLTVSKYTTWQAGDTPDPDQTFRFRVELFNPDGTPFEDGMLEYDLEEVENIGENPSGSGEDNNNGDASPGAGTEGSDSSTGSGNG